MVLHVAAQHFGRGCLADVECGRRRHGARVGGEEVAAGRQHVLAAARRRAGRAGRHMAAVERGYQRRALGLGAFLADRLAVRLSAAVDVQPVLDGEILEVAEPGVDAAQRLVRRVGAGDAGFAGQPGLRGGLDDQLRQPVAAAAVEPVGLRIFVDQPFELLLVLVEPGCGEWRRQVAERDGGDAALGLRGFAGVRHDEGIDDGQGTRDDLRKARAAHRHCLARQPLQRAVRADMHDGMDAERLAQPQAEGDEFVARRQSRVVVVGAAIGRPAAIGGERYGDVAEGRGAEGEAAVP